MNIVIENLYKYFASFPALSDVSLEIKDSELFFLLGPSGCGKTTLLRCIAGFEQASQGKILFSGKDVSSLPPHQRDSAMVFQGYALWPHMTVFENVSFGLEMKKLAKNERIERVKKALERMQISELADRRPNSLSGGQQQRVALARTLAVEPACLLLDEPLANLDAKLRRDMRQEIRKLCKENSLTGIYVTHDRQEALSMADRIAVMKDGRICQLGSPQEVYRRPVNSFVASFIGESNFIDAKVLSVENSTAEVETSMGIFYSSNFQKNINSGDKVLLSFRPEAIKVGKAEKNNINITLKQIEYLGEMSEFQGNTEEGKELKFYELNSSANWQDGEKRELHIAPEDAVILAD